MANTVVQTTRYSNIAQQFLRSALVAQNVTSAKFVDKLFPGYTINNPYGSSVVPGNYSFSTDITMQATTLTSDTYNISNVKQAGVNFDPYQSATSIDLTPEDQYSGEIGYQLARIIDQFCWSTMSSGSGTTLAGGTLNAGNMFEFETYAWATLTRNRAMQGTRFIVVDAAKAQILANTDKANGFQLADTTLTAGRTDIGGMAGTSAGFKVFVSNDLPYSVALTIAANPTAGDTISLAGQTWTFRANGTASVAGDISLGTGGSALADTQASVVQAISGTGTPGASNYIDFATNDRRSLQQMQLTAGSFSGNISTITSFGQMTAQATFTSGSNSMGTETGVGFAGVVGAMDLTIQKVPQIFIRELPANASKNIFGITQYGGGVFKRWQPSLAKLTWNVSTSGN